MKYLVLGILFWGTNLFPLQAQQVYHFRKLTVNEGLNDNDIYTIGQDKYGYMWFGSFGGLNRFDGYHVKWFSHVPGDSTSPLGSLPQSMVLDTEGRFWIGFENGLMEYLYEQASFRKVKAAGSVRIDQLLQVSPRFIFMATDQGLARVDTHTDAVKFYRDAAAYPAERKLFNTRVFSIALKDGLLYMAARAGLFVFDIRTESIRKIETPGIELAGVGGEMIVSLAIDHDDCIWAGTYGRTQLFKLQSLQDSGHKVVRYDRYFSSSEKIIFNNVNAVLLDRQQKIWVVTSVDGLLEYLPGADSLRKHLYMSAFPGSPSGNLHRCIFQDRDGLIWFGGNQGLNYFNPSDTFFTTILPFDKELDVRNRRVARGVTEDAQGNLWFGTLDGVCRYSVKDNSYREWSNKPGQPPVIWYNSVRSLLRDKENNIWIATGGGVNRFLSDQQQMEFVRELPSIFYFSINKDRKNRLWFCSRDKDGFYWYDPVEGSFQGIAGHPDLKVFAGLGGRYFMEDSKGRYWFGFNGKGLGMYNPANGNIRRWTTDDGPNTIAGNFVIDLKEDKAGVIWVSTTSGLTGIDLERNVFRSFTSREGLLSNTASALEIDETDRIWVATTRGITMIDTSRSVFTGFGVKEGLPVATFYEHAGYKAANGDFIFPSVNGYVRFDPLKFRENNRLPKCYLSGISVFNEPYAVQGEISDLQSIFLNAAAHSFTLDFVALYYENPDQLWYAYRLEGFDKDWKYTRQRQANYTNIPGGDYVFRVKATLNPLNWETPEQRIRIKVDTVFYKTWYFLLFSFTALASLFYGVYLYRIRQQEKLMALYGRSQLLEKEKALIMYESLKQQLNPHFLFNSLTSLRSLIRTQPDRAGDFLDRLSGIYRYILKNRERETVLLCDEVGFAETYVQLQQTRLSQGFFVNIRISYEHLQRKIVPVTLQNLVENAIKHNLIDGESPLVVDIFVEEDFLVVRNNLQRKEFVATSNGQGLQNLRSIYTYFSDKQVIVMEDGRYFTVQVPLVD